MPSKRAGYPILGRSFVPAEHRSLHDFLLKRRSEYHAHTDATAAKEHRRHVSETAGWIHITEPDALTSAQRLELAELADKLGGVLRERLARASSGAEGAN